MKVLNYLLILIAGVWLILSIQGCASTAEQEDIYGEVIKEITGEVDTTELATLSEENESLKKQVSNLQSQVAKLQSEKSELEKKVASLQETNAQLTAKISDLGSQLEYEKQRSRELSAKDSEIAEYKKQIRDLEAKIAELEVKLSTKPPTTVAGEVKGEVKLPGIIPEPTIKMTEKEFKSYYDRGLNNFRKRNYKNAIAYFDTLLKSDLETNLKVNVIYWLGESYFALKQYDKAIEYFNYVAQTKSAKTPDALYMLGRCYAALGKIKEAKEYMNRVVKEYPKSPVAKKAKDRLERL
jgi:tol-pal system protein YbgF